MKLHTVIIVNHLSDEGLQGLRYNFERSTCNPESDIKRHYADTCFEESKFRLTNFSYLSKNFHEIQIAE